MRSRFAAHAAKKSRRAQLLKRAPRISPTIEAAHIRDVLRVVKAFHALIRRSVTPQLRQDVDWRSLKDRAVKLAAAFTATALATARRMMKFSKAEAVRTMGDMASDLSDTVSGFAETFAADAVEKLGGLLDESLDAAEEVAGDALVVGEEVGTFTLDGVLEAWLSRSIQSATNMITQGTAELNQDRHEEMGVTDYVWISMIDGKTRPEHAALNNQECRYDDPPLKADQSSNEEDCNPGEDFSCRCQASPIVSIDAEAASDDEQAAEAAG